MNAINELRDHGFLSYEQLPFIGMRITLSSGHENGRENH